MKIEIAYALLEKQKIYTLEIEESVTIREAVALTAVLDDFPEADIADCKLGVFGKVVADKYQLQEGDRIEIYRPLIADPKEVRKQRAEAGKKMKKGGGDAQ